MNFLLYGSYGYTGELILQEALKKGLKPVLSGRNEDKVKNFGARYHLFADPVDLDDPVKLRAALKEVDLVVHAAGPFSITARPMMEACIDTGTHYFDITGEIEVFERAASLGERAEKAGVLLLPGTGFDVVPSDCLAKYVSEAMPDATQLQLAFMGIGAASRGTTKTAVEHMHKGGMIRKNGELTKVPHAYKQRKIKLGTKEVQAVTIPWGDVSTAFYSTGIPNIEVYSAFPPSMIRSMKMMNFLNPILGMKSVRRMLQYIIERRLYGPDEDSRRKGKSYLWARATNDVGEFKEAWLDTPEGYTLTAMATVEAIRVLSSLENVPTGFKTPAQAFGADFVTTLPGVTRYDKPS